MADSILVRGGTVVDGTGAHPRPAQPTRRTIPVTSA